MVRGERSPIPAGESAYDVQGQPKTEEQERAELAKQEKNVSTSQLGTEEQKQERAQALEKLAAKGMKGAQSTITEAQKAAFFPVEAGAMSSQMESSMDTVGRETPAAKEEAVAAWEQRNEALESAFTAGDMEGFATTLATSMLEGKSIDATQSQAIIEAAVTSAKSVGSRFESATELENFLNNQISKKVNKFSTSAEAGKAQHVTAEKVREAIQGIRDERNQYYHDLPPGTVPPVPKPQKKGFFGRLFGGRKDNAA